MCPAAGLPPAGGQDAGRPGSVRLAAGGAASSWLTARGTCGTFIRPGGARPREAEAGSQGPTDDQQDTLQGEREPVQFRLAAVEGYAPDTARS